MEKIKMLEKVERNNGIYDTRKYRYVSYHCGYALVRCPIEYIGTTEALNWDNWEVVIK